MNDKQRLLVMVGTGSLLVLLISIFGLRYGIEKWRDHSDVNYSVERWEKETGLKLKEYPAKHHDKLSDGTIIGDIFAPLPIDRTYEYNSWVNDIKLKEGILKTSMEPSTFFKKMFIRKEGFKTNWLGIVACFNIAFCITGFFLFKDK